LFGVTYRIKRNQKPIAPLRQSLDEARLVGRVPQRLPEPHDGGTDSGFELHDCSVWPEFLLHFFPCDYLTRSLEQHLENLNGLVGNLDSDPVLAQFPCPQVHLESFEVNNMAVSKG
jgi:hypothetical protein